MAFLTSLRLTVALLALLLFLVFCGTLAQIDHGIWTVVNDYFRNAGIVWIPLRIFFPRNLSVGGSFPYPGGWLIGVALLLNLLAAHAVRFRLCWSRSGILLIHLGLLVMLLSEALTGLLAVEGSMTIEAGGSADYLEHREIELAVVDRSDPAFDQVTAVPQGFLERGGPIRDERLPFDIVVDRFMAHSDVVEGPAGPEASAILTLKGKDGTPLGTHRVSLWLAQPARVTAGGREYAIHLRFRRAYKPYTLHLLEFRHDKYLGTDIPKNFSSRVRLTDPGRDVDREALISMNHPLRYAGETFYQSAFTPGGATVLQVVRNPGWLMPYVSCALVSLGLLVHFGRQLLQFLREGA